MGGFFAFDWSRWDPKLGLYHMIGALLFLNLAERAGADWLAAGVGALLTWLVVLLGGARGWRTQMTSLAVYLLGAIPLSYLAHAMAASETLSLAVMFVITFGFAMLLIRGAQAFVVGWCLTYWYMLSPLLSGNLGLQETVLGHLIGSAAVAVMYLLKRLWSRPEVAYEPQPRDGAPPLGFAAAYSAVVASTMVIGLGAGTRTLNADPTLISNAAFNIISPSALQTWRSGLLRMVFGTAGICLGFYLGVFFPEPWVGQLIVALSSFVALALLRVDFAPAVGALLVMVSYPWGTMDYETGNALANERILAELAGVLLAGVAISVLGLLMRYFPRNA